MVKHAFSGPAGFRKSVVSITALLAILSLANCRFLGSDMFPSTLSRKEAVLDLGSKLATLGVTGAYEVTSMKFLSSPATGKEYIFVRISAYFKPSWLIVLDAADLEVIEAIQNSYIGDVLFVDMDGYFVTGNESGSVRIGSATLDTVTSIHPPAPPPIPYGRKAFTEGTSSWLVWYDSMEGNLHYFSYDPDWNPGMADASALDSTPHADLSLKALYTEGAAIRLFLASSYMGGAYVVSFSDAAEFISSFSASDIFASPGTIHVSIPAGDDGSGWLTRDGAIILTHDDETRLVRYESDSGKELDSLSLDDTEDTRFDFSPDGKKWLLYDGANGTLHLLRTWW